VEASLKEVALGLHDLVVGADVVAHGPGPVRDRGAQPDERAAHGEVVDQLRVVARGTGGDGRQLQLHEVFRAAELLQPADIGGEVLQRRGVGGEPLGDARGRHLEDLAMDGVEEMVGFDQRFDPVEHVVGGQDRAQKLLLGLDVVGQGALAIVGCGAVGCRTARGHGQLLVHGSPSPVAPRFRSRPRPHEGCPGV
jgi:hypothetical protein